MTRNAGKQDLLVIGSLAGFFYEVLSNTARKLQLELSHPVQSYLVSLLSSRARQDYDPRGLEPIGPELLKALAEKSAAKRLSILKRIGDRALYEGGYFAARLVDSVLDVDYYRAIGKDAYQVLAVEHYKQYLRRLFSELAARFKDLSILLGEAAESGHYSPQSNLADLYNRWIATGSRQLAERLRSMGILPVKPGMDT
ncbi:MAG: hypothetical protein GXP49_02735 [Deltaproteobacteria bacterium]|nr:hypothetical protein [Deltaproteobacteria bacterium]